MLKANRVLLAFGLAALVGGCDGAPQVTETGGGGSGTTTSADGGGGASSTTTSTTTSEGGAGGGLTCDSDEATVLAVSQLALGEGDNGEWKSVGFNLDGLESTAASTDVCKPYMGADPDVPYPDGADGIDNSFGKNLLPLILGLYPTWVTDINNGIDNGFFTSLVRMECLPPTGDVDAFTTKLFGATDLGMDPKFDGTDLFPVAPELLADPMDPLSSTIIFPKSSVKGQLFDSGKNQTFILTVPLKTMTDETSIKLTLNAAQTIMTLAADRKSATGGLIGGVLNTEDFVAEIKKVGHLLGLCDTLLFNNLITQIREASDIMADGTQDPTKTCDGISMGLQFEMKSALIGIVGPASPPGMACN